MSKYLVVEFASHEVAIISEKWLKKSSDGTSKAFWPPLKSISQLTAAVKQHAEPDSNWMLCDVLRIMYTTGK